MKPLIPSSIFKLFFEEFRLVADEGDWKYPSFLMRNRFSASAVTYEEVELKFHSPGDGKLFIAADGVTDGVLITSAYEMLVALPHREYEGGIFGTTHEQIRKIWYIDHDGFKAILPDTLTLSEMARELLTVEDIDRMDLLDYEDEYNPTWM